MTNFSIAEFGSQTRANFDKYSDKDLLLVGNSIGAINRVKKTYEAKGYSVSSYTYRKLKYLSAKGSLFIDHLKKESVLIWDSDNQLANILRLHVTAIPNQEQLSNAREFFSILDVVPNTNQGFGWFCDCIYVGLRNLFILKSAQRGLYNFSFLLLLEEFVNSGDISLEDTDVLRELRVIKRNYREKRSEEFPSKSYVDKLILIMVKLGVLRSQVKLVDGEVFRNSVKERLEDKALNHYLKLRLMEMYYYTHNMHSHEIEKMICNPQVYASMFKNEKFVHKLIDKFSNKCHNQITLQKL